MQRILNRTVSLALKVATATVHVLEFSTNSKGEIFIRVEAAIKPYFSIPLETAMPSGQIFIRPDGRQLFKFYPTTGLPVILFKYDSRVEIIDRIGTIELMEEILVAQKNETKQTLHLLMGGEEIVANCWGCKVVINQNIPVILSADGVSGVEGLLEQLKSTV